MILVILVDVPYHIKYIHFLALKHLAAFQVFDVSQWPRDLQVMSSRKFRPQFFERELPCHTTSLRGT
jgi:hypothetical protein